MLLSGPALRVMGVVLALNAVAWLWFGVIVISGTASATFASTALLCFVLGMRHAFDADHLAAIDDTTRLLASRGGKPVSLGLGFAVGHSLVVFFLFFAVAITAAHLGSTTSLLQDLGSRVAMSAAAVFLLFVGILNVRLLCRLVKDPDGRSASLGGVMTRLLGSRLSGRIHSGWQMVPVGFVFGLGMETASEVALLGLSATAGSQGMPWWSLLVLPLLFAAGMALFDTLDSLMMTHLYTSDAASAGVRRTFNVAVTGLTAAIALGVGAVYAADVLRSGLGLDLLAPVAGLSAYFQEFGFVIVAIYVALWLTLIIRSRATSAVRSAAMVSASSSPTSAP
jgi:high-affinity nickel-transport protein